MADARSYTDFFKPFTEFKFGEFKNPFADFKVGDFKTPFATPDVNSLIAAQRRNMEAFSSANQVITEGVQAVTRRQAEILRSGVEEFVKASKEIFSGNSPEAGVAKQAQLAKSFVENAMNNAREVSEMVTKSQFEAFDLLNKRVLESIEEVNSSAATRK